MSYCWNCKLFDSFSLCTYVQACFFSAMSLAKTWFHIFSLKLSELLLTWRKPRYILHSVLLSFLSDPVVYYEWQLSWCDRQPKLALPPFLCTFQELTNFFFFYCLSVFYSSELRWLIYKIWPLLILPCSQDPPRFSLFSFFLRMSPIFY